MTQQTIIANDRYVVKQPHYDNRIGDVLIAVRFSEADTNLFGHGTEPYWLFDSINGKGLRVIPTSKVTRHV